MEKTLMQSEGFYVCKTCGEVDPAIIESEIPSHKDSIIEKNRYPYKRLNHLTESISGEALYRFLEALYEYYFNIRNNF